MASSGEVVGTSVEVARLVIGDASVAGDGAPCPVENPARPDHVVPLGWGRPATGQEPGVEGMAALLRPQVQRRGAP